MPAQEGCLPKGYLHGGCLHGGVPAWGVSAQGGVCPGGSCALSHHAFVNCMLPPHQLSVSTCATPYIVWPRCMLLYTPPPPVNRMTDRCKNITLPQTLFAGGKKSQLFLQKPWNWCYRLWDEVECIGWFTSKTKTTFVWCNFPFLSFLILTFLLTFDFDLRP